MTRQRQLNLVAVGGGSGLATLLRGLKEAVGTRLEELTAIVTVADDGGSSGRLRRDFGVLPPGDIRNCLVALARDEHLVAQLFQYRFANGQGLSGHSFGNLLLTALTGITGDFYQAILTAEELLSVRGRILPATLQDLRLRARGRSGRVYEGESAVGSSGEPLVALELEPARAAAFPAAVAAIRQADLIVLGPGSLYTSILPNLLIPGIAAAVLARRAQGVPVILPLNLMTQPGETDGMDATAHLEALARHLGSNLVDRVLVHSGELPEEATEFYAMVDSYPVEVNPVGLAELGSEVVACDLLAAGELVRHDPAKLRHAVLSELDRVEADAAAAERRVEVS